MTERTDGERVVLEGGRVVTPEGVLAGGHVAIEGERVVDVGAGSNGTGSRRGEGPAARRIDADGRVVMPGLVDLHGDDVERYRHPRSGERVDATTALATADRLTLAAGVTTKFDAIALEDAPEKNRSIEGAMELVEAVDEGVGLVADHRVHARCELTDPASVSHVAALADRPAVDVVSLMAHVPGRGQFEDEEAFAQRYADGRGAAADEAERAGRERRGVEASTLRERLDRLTDRLAGTETLVASHDDADPAAVDRAVDRGVELCEYPLSLPAARRASERGVATAVGAPNLVRGGSLWGNLDAREAIDAGVSGAGQPVAELGVVLDDPVVHDGERAAAVGVRVSVRVRRRPVRAPPGVSEADPTAEGRGRTEFDEVLDSTLSLDDLDPAPVPDGDARGVVPPVLEVLEPREERRHGVVGPDSGGDTAHQDHTPVRGRLPALSVAPAIATGDSAMPSLTREYDIVMNRLVARRPE